MYGKEYLEALEVSEAVEAIEDAVETKLANLEPVIRDRVLKALRERGARWLLTSREFGERQVNLARALNDQRNAESPLGNWPFGNPLHPSCGSQMARAKGRPRKVAARRHPSGQVVRDRVEPTPETLAKLKPDFLAESLGMETPHYRAAVEIRDAYRWITRPVDIQIRDHFAAPVGGQSSGDDEDPRSVKRYNDWCDEMDRRKIPVGRVLDFVIDEQPLGPPPGIGRWKAIAYIGLALYVDMHGIG